MSKRAASGDQPDDSRTKRNKTSSTAAKSSAAHTETMSTTAVKRVLVLGLSGHAPGRAMPSTAKKPRGHFRQMLNATTATAKQNGIELDIMQAKPSAMPSALKDIKEKLKAHPDGFVIGNGIRGTPEYTTFFEDLVNASREISPQTRLAFNTSPDDILECVLRNFT